VHVNQGLGLQEGTGDILVEWDAKVNAPAPTDSPFSKIFRTYFPLGGPLVRMKEGKEEGREGRGGTPADPPTTDEIAAIDVN